MKNRLVALIEYAQRTIKYIALGNHQYNEASPGGRVLKRLCTQ